MSILELHKKEKNAPFVWNAKKYYDHPDGEDLVGKLSFVVKNTTAFSTFFGVLYANVPPRPNTLGKLVRIAKFTVPGAAMGFAFTVTTYCSAVYRQKDDSFNHGLGGMVAGMVLGPATASMSYSVIGAVFLGALTYANKEFLSRGYSVKKIHRKNFSTYFTREIDTSRAPEIKGNWTKNA